MFSHQNPAYFSVAGFLLTCLDPIAGVNWQEQSQHVVLRE
jgi:hypothetical protein